jgi:possible signal transduction protein
LEKKHTEFFIATLSIFFMLYSLLILSQNTEISNVISVLMVLSTLIFFLLNFQRSKSKNRTNAICVVIYCFFRTVLDVNRLLTSHGNSVISETVSDILYSSSSIFILVPVALIFVSKLELIDKKQLLIDSIAIAACLYYILELIFYAALANVRGDITHAHIIFLVLALDIILNTSLFFLFSVFKISFFQKEDTLKIVAIIVICFANSLRVYTSMLQNQYHYIIFMVTYFLFFSVITQTLIFMKDDNTKSELMPKFKIHNIIMSKTTNTILFLFSFVVFIEVLLYYLNVEKNITNIFSVLFAMILYLLSNLNEKNNILEKNTKLAIESEVSIKAYNDMKGEYNKIINMSRIDPLTGLNNRSYMMAVFDELDSEKSLDNFAVFVIDIVQFKTINEITDHKTGDLVLKEIA